MFNLKSRSTLLCACTILASGWIHAQESVNAAGGDGSGSGGTVAYSIGQVVYTLAEGTGGTAVQGVQQTYAINDVYIAETEHIIALNAFPNPTRELLTLSIEGTPSEFLAYQMLDLTGRMVAADQIRSPQTVISMSQLSAASYLLHVTERGRPIRTFKIFKAD